MEPIAKAPIYSHSSAYARERGELDLFRESNQANISCKKDIEKSISGHFDGMRLDPELMKKNRCAKNKRIVKKTPYAFKMHLSLRLA